MLDASDIRACGGFLPARHAGLASGTVTDTAAGATVAGGRPNAAGGAADCGEIAVIADPSAACGGTCQPSGEESFTNEPEIYEDVIRSQDQESVEVAADSGVDSGLDKVADLVGAGGREAPEIGDPEFDAGLMPAVSCQSSVVSCRELLSATDGDGRGLGAGQPTRSVGETAPTQSVGARGIENSTSERGGTSHTRRAAAAGACGEADSASEETEEAELRKLQAQLAIETVKRQARAGPMAEAIRDLMASSPEAMEILKAFLPG